MSIVQTAVKYDLEVSESGRIEVDVPFPAGTPVAVFVVEQRSDKFSGVRDVAASSLDFWDNRWDDQDWNDAGPGRLQSCSTRPGGSASVE